MGKNYNVYIGSVGGGLSCSPDGGENWNRIRDPLPSECNVRALAVDPSNSSHVIAGTDVGLFHTKDSGSTWEKIDSPIDGTQVWSVVVDPGNPDTIFVGTRPNAFRSRDAGRTWEELNMGLNIPCPVGIPRTTNMIVDPRDSRTVWAGVEVDGVYRSLDGGDTWLQLPELGPDPFHGDIHGLALNPGQGVYATTPFGISSSIDEGESWQTHEFPKFTTENPNATPSQQGRMGSYCRGMILKTDDPSTMFVGNGDYIPGQSGRVQRSTDGGKSWEAVSLPVEPNSVIYWLGTHKAVPDVIAAASLYGYIYVTEDGGDTWSKRKKEFGEIRAVAVTPN